MRSFGGARIGLAAWLLGCATVADPGREPPPPKMEPMPPPEPGTAHPLAAAAAAETTEPEQVLEWDADARAIRCGEHVALPIRAGLTVYGGENDGQELIVTPPGSPPGAALIVLDVGMAKWSIDMSDPNFAAKLKEISERMESVEKKMPDAAGRLYAIVTGRWNRPAIGELHADSRTGDDGVVDAVFTLDETPGAIWRFVSAQAGPCVFLALELARPDAAQWFAPTLQRMCATKTSPCASRR